jgi:serine/threonine protein kinase
MTCAMAGRSRSSAAAAVRRRHRPGALHPRNPLAARLIHPHILTVLDSGEKLLTASRCSGTPCSSSRESPRGDSRRRTSSVSESKRLLREVADALGYAHQQGILHRDIKPENVLLADGHALVADFGIARPMAGPRSERLTETGLVVGTPGYMSPEQAAGEHNLDGRSDLFSLGCVFYEMLTGQSPFGGASPQARMARALSGQFTPVGTLLPEAADTGVMLGRLLAPNPADRYSDAAALVAELDRTSDPAVVAVRPHRPGLHPGIVALVISRCCSRVPFFMWCSGTAAQSQFETHGDAAAVAAGCHGRRQWRLVHDHGWVLPDWQGCQAAGDCGAIQSRR